MGSFYSQLLDARDERERFVSQIGVAVDENAADIVQLLNEVGIKTAACCSGVFSDHYDLSCLNLSVNDLLEQGYIKVPSFKFRMNPKICSNTVQIPRWFFDIQDAADNGGELASGGYSQSIDWSIHYAEPNRKFTDEMEGRGVGSIKMPRSQGLEWLHRVDSLEEYDSHIVSGLQQLERDLQECLLATEI